MKKLLYILVPALVLTILVSQVDDRLSEEAVELIDRIDTNGTSESYLFLLGIFAEEHEDPLHAGKDLLAEYRKLEADELYDIAEYPDSRKLALPKGDEFCRTWEEGCLEYIFSAEIDATNLIKNHSVLVSRSNRFQNFNEYQTLSKPTLSQPFPPYQYIATAERIKVLEAISLYRNGEGTKSIDNLLVQLSELRKSMRLQDNLIGKLVFLMKLSEVIDVLSVIMSNEQVHIQPIQHLSEAEKSFYMIAAREFAISYHTLKSIDKHPKFFEPGDNFPGWLTRPMYKPNMTINAIAPIYYRLENLAKLSPPDFAERVENEGGPSPSTSKFRNYVGGLLISESPNFEKYVARFFDFDAKLSLFNQVHILKYDLDSMKNPYYGSEIPEELHGKLCFSGPLKDTRSLRCLKVKI